MSFSDSSRFSASVPLFFSSKEASGRHLGPDVIFANTGITVFYGKKPVKKNPHNPMHNPCTTLFSGFTSSLLGFEGTPHNPLHKHLLRGTYVAWALSWTTPPGASAQPCSSLVSFCPYYRATPQTGTHTQSTNDHTQQRTTPYTTRFTTPYTTLHQKPGTRARSQGGAARSQELGARSQKPGASSHEQGARNQEP